MVWGTRSYVILGIKPKWVFGSRPKSYVALVGTAFSILVLLFLILRLGGVQTSLFSSTKSTSSSKFALSAVSPHVCNNASEGVAVGRYVIPNQVHYIWLLRDPALFQMEFKHFVSFYSAHLYFEPNIIYIHTDATPEVFAHAKKAGDDWTRRILNLAYVEYNHITPPTETRNGVKIKGMKHQTEFLRTEILHQFGGIYLDTNAIPLRSITDLRYSGFANIVGDAAALSMKQSSFINNGVMLAMPKTTMMDLYIQAAHEHFDGKWTTAGVFLLTDIARRLAAVPNEVLVLSPQAFAPMSWERANQERLFKPHEGEPTSERPSLFEVELDTCREVFSWIEKNEAYEREDWELDFSGSYVLHAFDDDARRIRGWNGGVSLQYVLARRSNYARIVYPAIAHAIKAGVIPEGEALGNGWTGS